MKREELNLDLYEKIISSSKLLLKREHDKRVDIIEAIDCLTGIAAGGNLNQVSDIYIYEEGFADTDAALKNTIVHAITSIIAFEYGDENMTYLEDIILNSDNHKSDIALDYFLKIGRYHQKFQDRVLGFIEANIDSFSKNKLNVTAFYLVKLYQQDSRVVALSNKIKALYNTKYRTQENLDTNVNESPEVADAGFVSRLKKYLRKIWG